VEGKSLFSSLEALDAFLPSLEETLSLRPGPLVIGGFSQGGSTSLAYALTRPGSVAGVVVLSGFLVSTEVLGNGPELLGKTPVFWAHGTRDPAVPFQLALQGRNRLIDAGIRLEARDYPMGHWVTPQEVSDLRSWLEDSVPGWRFQESDGTWGRSESPPPAT
jgi:phospholipase/carboxylesterase